MGSTSILKQKIKRVGAGCVSPEYLRTVSALALLCGAGLLAISAPVVAQIDLSQTAKQAVDTSQPMMLEALELQYDFDNDIIVAFGGVEIYFDNYTLQADRVTYNRKDGKFSAHGNVRMTEPDGNLILADNLTLSDDFSEGFIQALQIDTPQFTHFIAESAERSGDNVTTLNNGTYSVYQKAPKPPLWQIKSTTIIHNQQERRIYFEGASIELFGHTIAKVPYFSIADPSVGRKSGFLLPRFIAKNRLGYGTAIPYYWSLSPTYDMTVTVTPLTKQGVLGQLDWRQKFDRGSYNISVGGISQADPNEFLGSSGDVRGRFIVHTDGSFNLSSLWKTGWDITYATDRAFREDYGFAQFGSADEVSKLYLKGQTQRNLFDANAYAFQLTQENNPDPTQPMNPVGPFTPVNDDLQEKQPYVHPSIDNSIYFEKSILGGQLNYDGNLTSLTRETTDAFSVNGVDRFRGVEGTFTRLSANLTWQRTFIDPLGQVFTPFAYAKTNLYFLANADENVTELSDDAVVFRGMPAVGLEYRYPFLSSFNGGNQIIEPVAQLIVRPNETSIGELPNEDAQSIVFDASTLFEWDKFSGFDRNEGGTRANIGLQYKLQFDQGSFVSALFGRSFQLAGENSYSVPGILDATGDSGLQTTGSDYVTSLYFDTNTGFRIGGNARFNEHDFGVARTEISASGRYGPASTVLSYAYLAERPDAGIDEQRSEVVGALNLNLQENWRLFGSLRYDIINENIVQDTVGVGYDDEGFSASISYGEDRSRNNGEPVERILFFRFGLRTIGDTSLSTSTSESNAND
ncbi:LPS-assembly protein LptD precursor [Pseudovibrio axinellae]|uniref:LPS-assembly protein LptD n=1 Tax=Pseudovibrio axinellae TaxID=989403 RepID=A0A161V3J0_9HYPH|nr:LPS-assembly protein LptD [Pseudovibrio axinellae]KZL12502.1 LPS-assembly protein LptD precursor [Pseudovibrio axinellae]SEP69466.1 LPS-assembly protein [Pseudovibrio axinellae]